MDSRDGQDKTYFAWIWRRSRTFRFCTWIFWFSRTCKYCAWIWPTFKDFQVLCLEFSNFQRPASMLERLIFKEFQVLHLDFLNFKDLQVFCLDLTDIQGLLSSVLGFSDFQRPASIVPGFALARSEYSLGCCQKFCISNDRSLHSFSLIFSPISFQHKMQWIGIWLYLMTLTFYKTKVTSPNPPQTTHLLGASWEKVASR